MKKSFIPIASIQRIDEVDKHGEAKIKKGLTEVKPFPLNIQPTKKSD